MMRLPRFSDLAPLLVGLSLGVSAGLTAGAPATAAPLRDYTAPVTPFALAMEAALREARAFDGPVGLFYRARALKPIWVTDESLRRGVLGAMAQSGAHGLPAEIYGAMEIAQRAAFAANFEENAAVELEMTQAFLRYARDLNSGVLKPRQVDKEIDLKPEVKSAGALLSLVVELGDPNEIVRRLMPQDPDYRRLLAEKARLETELATREIPAPIPTNRLIRPGFKGDRILLLRARLASLGYEVPLDGRLYDPSLVEIVRRYQEDNDLIPDGVLGPATLGRMNASPASQLELVLVNLERHRWLNIDRGPRHIHVNIADFSMVVRDNGIVTFSSDVVVGKNTWDRRTPEFNHLMTHMVINPYWHVPKSIARREYLPLLKKDDQALARRGLLLLNSKGQVLNTRGADFSVYSERYFPFFIKQPPGNSNALGLVKFMFPNTHNIYLHDTPAKKLFGRDRRDFSHGCIRVARPFDLAYHLLARQAEQPEAVFQKHLRSKRERQVNLDEPLPIFLTYHTAFGGQDGTIVYRDDIYGRDAKIAKALHEAGVAIPGIGG